MSQRVQKHRHQQRREPPPSGQRPRSNLVPRDIKALAEALTAFHTCFHDLFVRREQREWSALYLRGQLSDLERKTVEPMVLALKGADPAAVRAVQQFLGQGLWDDDPILWRLQRLIAEELGADDGVVVIDGSSFPKQGRHSVGVARQYCGHLGKVANCQHAVFAAYSSAKGHAFLDRRLYMPEGWFNDTHAPRRIRAGVPERVTFKTEPQLGLAIVQGLVERGRLPFQWVLADETYGADPKFLDGVDALGRWYFVEVPVTTRVWSGPITVEPAGKGAMGRPRKYARAVEGTPKPREVRQMAQALPATAWRRYTIQEGAKGRIEAECACLRITRSKRHGKPGAEAWAVFRRNLSVGTPVKVFLTNAPASCAKRELARMSGMRWPIETAFQEAKGEVGMDHYEVRTWRGWHHHMTQTFLAHYFLVHMRVRGEKSRADHSAGQATARSHTFQTNDHARTRHRPHPVSASAELRGVPVAPDQNRVKPPQTPDAA
jgi:SRSO17 transposase